jgi:hypothetical protein
MQWRAVLPPRSRFSPSASAAVNRAGFRAAAIRAARAEQPSARAGRTPPDAQGGGSCDRCGPPGITEHDRFAAALYDIHYAFLEAERDESVT